MFGRKRRSDDVDESEPVDDLGGDLGDDIDGNVGDGVVGDGVEGTATASDERPAGRGPWDASELPDDGIGRIDLGGLLMPVLDGTELRIDVDQASGALVSATLATPTSVMQVLAFAAPRSTGIWAEVRTEIVESIRSNGGKADVVAGTYGPEVVADVPGDLPGQLTPSRFLGVDGPRWFLRALVQGQAAETPSAEPILQQAFGLIGVARGDEAMTVREGIPLRLPKDLVPPTEAEVLAQEPESERPPLTLPERGPENTETR